MTYVKFNDLEDGKMYLSYRNHFNILAPYTFIKFFKYDLSCRFATKHIFHIYVEYCSVLALNSEKVTINTVGHMGLIKSDNLFFELTDDEIMNHVVIGAL